MRELVISPADAEQRLDKFLLKYLRGAEKGFLFKMLRKKNITLNGHRAEGSERLGAGDVVRLFLSEETLAKMGEAKEAPEISAAAAASPAGRNKAPAFPAVSVLYEDPHILAVNKPAGLLSQKAAPEDISLNDWLRDYLAGKSAEAESSLTFAPGIANRLDRNTSGLVLAGKTLTGQQLLTELLRRRALEKLYLCVVSGRFSRARTSRLYWTKRPDNTVDVSAVLVEGASLVELQARPLELFGEYSLLEVHLISGKSHQIRAQLAYLGNPILGDGKYGNAAGNRAASASFGFPLRQQLLHAWSVRFPESLEEEETASARRKEAFDALRGRRITAPLPAQFARVLQSLGSEKLKEL